MKNTLVSQGVGARHENTRTLCDKGFELWGGNSSDRVERRNPVEALGIKSDVGYQEAFSVGAILSFSSSLLRIPIIESHRNAGQPVFYLRDPPGIFNISKS